MGRTQITGKEIADGASGVNLGVDVTGVLPVPNGGTGQSALAAAGFVIANGSGSMSSLVGTAANQVPQWNGSAWSAGLPAQLNAKAITVSTSETTTSTTYTDLTTSDAIAVTIGPSGMALVSLFSQLANGTTAATYLGFAASGANTITASDAQAVRYFSSSAGSIGAYGASYLLTGLAAGVTTFKLKAKVASNTGTYVNRNISVIPL